MPASRTPRTILTLSSDERISHAAHWKVTFIAALAVALLSALTLLPAAAQTPAAVQAQGWPSHAGNAQHTAVSSVAAQPLAKIHWQTPVDLKPPSGEIVVHYGSPLVTPAGTVIVPVKTGTDEFRIEAHNQATGTVIWTLKTAYTAPSSALLPSFSPVLFNGKLYLPDDGGKVAVRDNPDQATGKLSRLVFFGASNFTADPKAYNANVRINTPITADAAGNLYFGFVVLALPPLVCRAVWPGFPPQAKAPSSPLPPPPPTRKSPRSI